MTEAENKDGGLGLKKIWRKVSSYAYERVIEESSSPFNPHLEVWYIYGKYVLNAESVNLSFGLLDKVFRSAFSQVRIERRGIRKVLILGLGVGNIPSILNEYDLDFEMTGVEIDPEVIRLGNKYFGLDKHKSLKIETADAIEWVWSCRETYDLITVDLFIDSLIPEAAQQEEYLRHLASLLAPGGILLYNRLMHSPELKAATLTFSKLMQEALPGTRYLKANSNRMMVYEKK